MAENAPPDNQVDSLWKFTQTSHTLTLSSSSITINNSSPTPLTIQSTTSLEASSLDKYFEFTIDELQGSVSVGLATKTHPMSMRVGYASTSWGLQGDRGCIVVDGYETATGIIPSPLDAKKGGYTIGCGVSNFQVFWTLNGRFLGFYSPQIPEALLASLRATLTVVGGPAKISFNPGTSPQTFSIGVKKRQLNLVLKITPSRGNEHIEPKERYSPAVAVSGHTLIAHGGRGRFSQLMSDLCYFDLLERKWEIVDAEGGDKPPKLYGHSGVTFSLLRHDTKRRFFLMYGGRMLSVGRWRESYSPWLLDIETRVWSRPWLDALSMPHARYAHSAVVWNNIFYVFGGYNSEMKTCLSDLQALNISRIDDASQKHPFKQLWPHSDAATNRGPCSRYGHSMVAYNNKLFVFGGRTRDLFLNDLWEFDLTSNKWAQPRTSPICPSTRYRHTASLVNDHYMVVIGGSSKDTSANTDVWILDLNPDETGTLNWDRLFAQIEPIYGHGACVTFGLEEKNYKFRAFSRWDSNPSLERSPSLSSSSGGKPSFRARWSVGILLFGGAAETGLNNHPRKISNSILWMILNLNSSGNVLNSSSSGELPLLTEPLENNSAPTTAVDSPASPTVVETTQPPPSSSIAAAEYKNLRKSDTNQQVENPAGPTTTSSRIVFKCVNGNDIRMVTTAPTVKLSKLVRKIQKEFDEQGPISLKYVDQDGDLVSLVRTSDLKTAVRLHEILNSTTIKLHLFSLDSRGSGGTQLLRDPKHDSDSSRSTKSSSPAASAATVDGFNSLEYLWHVPHAELEFKNVLGKGYFGEVRRALFRGAVVACKVIYRHSFHNKHDMELFVQEVDLLAKLRHPKVISFIGASFDADDKVIVMEYMKYGSLYDALRRPDLRQNILSSPPTQLRIALDISQGMSYLHSKRVLHRDLTSKNILLDAYMTAKVSDLGLSRMKSDAIQLSGTFGAIPWQAPEILNGSPFDQSADVYSFGCCLWEIFTGEDLAPSSSGLQLADKIRAGWRPEIPLTIPASVADLVRSCWATDPSHRPSFEDIIRTLRELGRRPEFGGEATEEDDSSSEEQQVAPQSWEGYDI